MTSSKPKTSDAATEMEETPSAGISEAQIQYFEKQKKIYPRRVWGRYRILKWTAMIITLGIYYLVPFIRWDRGPNAPDQAVLIDLPARRAYWFFVEIWPQEVYYLTAILVFAAIGLFFATALFGRVWCGYFCPQTVWTDLFVWVERIIQGDRNARMKLDNGPLTFEKIWKKGLTHLVWLMIGLATGGAFVFYFNDAPTLWGELWHFEASTTVLVFIFSLTFSTYLMAGFAREQVCTFMCPYARFQSAMFDQDTLIIGYDEERGEPRGKHKKGESWAGRGHCIDCTQCVQVCPMGIDIREGLQIQCIACGLCVDACNNVMDKVDLPRGLIRYDTGKHMSDKESLQVTLKEHIIRPRTIYYSVVLLAVCALVVYGQMTRQTLDLHVLHDRNPLFVKLSDGDVRNGYKINILNRTHAHKHYTLTLDGVKGAEMIIQGAGDLRLDDLFVPADTIGHFRVFVKAPSLEEQQLPVVFTITDHDTKNSSETESIFISRRAGR